MRRIDFTERAQGVVTHDEVHAALRRSKHLRGIRRTGPHTVYEGPRGSVPVPNHRGDCPRGTWRSICRLAILAGLAALALVVVLAL